MLLDIMSPVRVPFTRRVLSTVNSGPSIEEHGRNYLPTKDTSWGTKMDIPIVMANKVYTPTSEEWPTSLQWTKWLVPVCPL